MRIADVRIRCLGVFVGLACCVVGVRTESRAQGNFVVTEADISAMKLHHYFDTRKQSHDADFTWSFKAGKFMLKKGKVDIPADLCEQLLAAGTAADEIGGAWTLKNGELVLTEIHAGTRKGRSEVRLSVYMTAPTVVRVGYDAPQYVFAVAK